MKNKKIYISDIIGDEYKEWNNEKVILDCGTGRGKTYFILNILCLYALQEGKSVLYLCNRDKLKEQIEGTVNKYNLYNVTVMNYQKLQHDINYLLHEDINYDYVIADEVHYIFKDATLNFYTDITYEYLFGQNKNIVVYMSATAKSLFGMVKKESNIKENRVYKLDTDYSYVDRVYFYDRKKLTKLIDNILVRSDDKAVVFVNSDNTMLELYDKYQDEAHFYSSVSSEKLKDIREENCIVSKGDKITFEKRLLFTTTALDNGVDLKDDKIRYMISEVFEPDTAIQCLGRKRPIKKEDICTFFIANYEKPYISFMKNINTATLEPLKLFMKDLDEYERKYGRDREFISPYIYYDWGNNTHKINMFGFYQLMLRDQDMIGMITHGYVGSMSRFNMSEELASKVNDITTSSRAKQNLNKYLNSVVNKPLLEKEQIELMEKLHASGIEAKSYSKISIELRNNGFKYRIISDRSREYAKHPSNISKKCQPTAWIIKRM